MFHPRFPPWSPRASVCPCHLPAFRFSVYAQIHSALGPRHLSPSFRAPSGSLLVSECGLCPIRIGGEKVAVGAASDTAGHASTNPAHLCVGELLSIPHALPHWPNAVSCLSMCARSCARAHTHVLIIRHLGHWTFCAPTCLGSPSWREWGGLCQVPHPSFPWETELPHTGHPDVSEGLQ